jgi:valyl-tRNA synthetase
VTVPFVEREIEILADDYVDPEFGTGVLKVTPAHDPNDFEIGQRLGLPQVNVLNPDGTINAEGARFEGLSREEARKAIAEGLSDLGLLGDVKEYIHRVGHCDRCGTVIEPWLSEQWWVAMRDLAGPAIEALKNEEITVYPDTWRRETIRWLENLQDWNVSRQLWWGQRIPIWYGPDGEVVASKESPGAGYEQDPDILDTWFSSALWPIATMGWPEETQDLEFFYPTSLLSTAREIMYLWVARMIMTGLRYRGEVPFEKINVHSIVLAADGTKMSKSKGNVIDPLDLFDEYGTDAVRFGLLYQSSTQDFAYSHDRALQGRGFVTKLWNAMRFVASFPEPDGDSENGDASEFSYADRWILSSFDQTAREYDSLLEECEFSEAMRRIYDFAWHEFADWYIEIAKAAPSSQAPGVIREVFYGILRLLHPVMPFATEEMAQSLGYAGNADRDELLARQEFPVRDEPREDPEAERVLDVTRRAVSAVRSFRAESKVEGELEGRAPEGSNLAVFAALARVKLVESVDGATRATLPAGEDLMVEISLSEEMRQDEIERLRREIERVEGELDRVQKKLANEKFVERAPAEVVGAEREKRDANARMLDTLRARLDSYL